MKDLAEIAMLLALVVLIIALGPIFTIWALNRIAGTAIELNFFNWLSALWLSAIVGSVSYRSKK